MIASPTGSRGIRAARARRAGGLGLHQGQRADSRHDRRGPSGGLHIAKLVVGGDPARADQLDPVPRSPVCRLGSQPLDPEPFLHAGGPMNRPGRAQVGKHVGPPRLGRNACLKEAIEQLANGCLSQRLGPGSRGTGEPLNRVRRVHPRHPAYQLAQLHGIVDRVENHQAILGGRRGHGR